MVKGGSAVSTVGPWKHKAAEARRLIPIRIKVDGPIGIAHFGDPHVDDDGTNIELLEQHVKVVNATDGLFAANVGDYRNNWVGRLARLWADSRRVRRNRWCSRAGWSKRWIGSI
jgi:hypothetical protein